MTLRVDANFAIFGTFLFCCVNAETFTIYRSACRNDAMFKAVDKDKKLVGNSVASIHVTSLGFCARKCTSVPTCQTLNYKKSPSSSEDLNCQLLSVTKSNASATISAAPGWNHYQSMEQIGPRCRFVTCNPGYKCVETCAKESGYECIDINECLSNPCQNGAACTNNVNSYTCTCVAGYEGTNCQTNTNECASSPCQNSGQCNDGINQYSCSCVAGYTGTNCQTNINECSSSPCLNGGACSDGINRYTCSCAAGYAGTRCETNVNECASTPCQNGGTCSDAVNQYTCTCASGFSGAYCQTSSSECSSYTTLQNADRHMSSKGTAVCDSSLSEGWYRFMGAAGSQMPTSCVGANFCSTHAAGWLSGTHPTTFEGIVTRTVCFSYSNNCCWSSKSISVRNCGSYYVYKLGPPPGCTLRYCGQ